MDAYDYLLPEASVAQQPVEPRSSARLLDATDPSGAVVHRRVADLPALVGPGDVIVVNDTRVIPARLALRRDGGGQAEVLLLEPRDGDVWEALVRPGRKLPPGAVLSLEGEPVVEVGDRLDEGRRLVRLLDPGLPARVGAVPLPPYIHAPLADPERYQTVYAAHPGSVAAPTAGLHFTPEVLEGCRQAGAEVAYVDLTVGLDTFRPVTAERPEDHVIHTESYRVPATTMEATARARRVIAVGTTTVRALESAAGGDLEGRTALFIRPGYQFRVVDALLTNFHLPRSSLLLLLAAFCGPRWRDLYAAGLADGYRFLSFGDAMLVSRA